MTRKISGSVELISRMLTGKVPALPRIGFSVVDVRDLAALHIKAMRDSKAAGQRFLGMGDFLWMEDRAKLRTNLMGLRLPPKFGVRQSPAIVVSQVKRMRLRRTYLENERIGDSACGAPPLRTQALCGEWNEEAHNRLSAELRQRPADKAEHARAIGQGEYASQSRMKLTHLRSTALIAPRV